MAYSKAQIDRIGNLLVYITSKLGPTSKTKLLKLIYIIEEESVKQAGVPFTDLKYTYFPLGPVSTFVTKQIEKRREEITRFVSIEKSNNCIWVAPAVEFDSDEFSDFDLELIDGVLAKFGSASANALIEYTHREGGLWKQIDDEYGGAMPPNNKRDIDLLKLLDQEEIGDDLRQVAKEEKAFLAYLKSQE